MTVLSTTERVEQTRPLPRTRPAVPWRTVATLAVVLSFADGFWLTSLRSAVGAIERTQSPFASWLRESLFLVPAYAVAVLAALTLAMRWFGPELRRPRAVVATALLVVAAGTLLALAVNVASSAYDYHLQSAQLQLMGSMPSMPSMGSTAQLQQASLALQMRAVGYGGALLLVTNLALVGWVVAFRGGRLDVIKTRQ